MIRDEKLRWLSASSDSGPYTVYVRPEGVRRDRVTFEAGISLRREGGRKVHLVAKEYFAEADYRDAEEAFAAARSWVLYRLEEILQCLQELRQEIVGNE